MISDNDFQLHFTIETNFSIKKAEREYFSFIKSGFTRPRGARRTVTVEIFERNQLRHREVFIIAKFI